MTRLRCIITVKRCKTTTETQKTCKTTTKREITMQRDNKMMQRRNAEQQPVFPGSELEFVD